MMTDERLAEVITRYDLRLRALPPSPSILHMRGLIPQMRTQLQEGCRDKVLRWLGFLQGSFWLLGEYTLTELKAHDAPEAPP